jgi:hypothetical protein
MAAAGAVVAPYSALPEGFEGYPCPHPSTYSEFAERNAARFKFWCFTGVHIQSLVPYFRTYFQFFVTNFISWSDDLNNEFAERNAARFKFWGFSRTSSEISLSWWPSTTSWNHEFAERNAVRFKFWCFIWSII